MLASLSSSNLFPEDISIRSFDDGADARRRLRRSRLMNTWRGFELGSGDQPEIVWAAASTPVRLNRNQGVYDADKSSCITARPVITAEWLGAVRCQSILWRCVPIPAAAAVTSADSAVCIDSSDRYEHG